MVQHLLIQGDAENRDTLPCGKAHLIITSPPYNVGMEYGARSSDSTSYERYLQFSRRWLGNCLAWAAPKARLCLNVALDKNKFGKQPLAADLTHAAMQSGWKYFTTIIWNEGTINRRTAWGSWKSASAPHVIAPVETILVFYKNEWKRGKAGTSDITADEFKEWTLGHWTFPGESAKRIGHKAPFPRELPKRCIKLFSFQGDTILDPFLGSGTTLIEAVRNRRAAIGIELEEANCQLARRRLLETCNTPLLPSPKAPQDPHTTQARWAGETP